MTNRERVLRYILECGSITQKEAYDELGNSRLSASIWDLIHKDGYYIDSIIEHGRNRWGEASHWSRYYLRDSLFEKNLKNKGVIKDGD